MNNTDQPAATVKPEILAWLETHVTHDSWQRPPEGLEATDVVQFLGDKLGETEPEPLRQIAEAVEKLGPATAIRLLRETLDIEAQGGLMTHAEPQRRRTPGGIYLSLAKMKIERVAKAQKEARKRAQQEAEAKAQAQRQAQIVQPRPKPEKSTKEPEVIILRRPKRPPTE
jgi:hypothetical protein